MLSTGFDDARRPEPASLMFVANQISVQNTEGKRSRYFLNPQLTRLLPRDIIPVRLPAPINRVTLVRKGDLYFVDLYDLAENRLMRLPPQRFFEAFYDQGGKLYFPTTDVTTPGQMLVGPDDARKDSGGHWYVLEINPILTSQLMDLSKQYYELVGQEQPETADQVSADIPLAPIAESHTPEVVNVMAVDYLGNQKHDGPFPIDKRLGVKEGAQVVMWDKLNDPSSLAIDRKRDVVKLTDVRSGQSCDFQLSIFRSRFSFFGKKFVRYQDDSGSGVRFCAKIREQIQNGTSIERTHYFDFSPEVFEVITNRVYHTSAVAGMDLRQGSSSRQDLISSDEEHRLGVDHAGHTDKGKVREHNEDNYLVHEFTVPGVGAFQLAVVADGMGGHQAGEVASAEIIKRFGVVGAGGGITINQEIINNMMKKPQGLYKDIDPAKFTDIVGKWLAEMLVEAIQGANASVYHAAQSDEKKAGMGSTVVAAITFRPERNKSVFYATAHVGDSRAYGLSSQGISQLTRDHSWATEQEGFLTPEQIARHPYRHVITRVVGQQPSVEVDTNYGVLKEERLLLCTDGLTGPVSNQEIGQIYQQSSRGDQFVGRLVDKANFKGGPDNITAVLVS